MCYSQINLSLFIILFQYHFKVLSHLSHGQFPTLESSDLADNSETVGIGQATVEAYSEQTGGGLERMMEDLSPQPDDALPREHR